MVIIQIIQHTGRCYVRYWVQSWAVKVSVIYEIGTCSLIYIYFLTDLSVWQTLVIKLLRVYVIFLLRYANALLFKIIVII